MFINIINSYRYVVAICDENLLGKKFYEGDHQLDIKESFYKSKNPEEQTSRTKEETLELMRKMSLEDATFNIVGRDSVQTALEAGIINEEGVKEISGIPYAMVLL